MRSTVPAASGRGRTLGLADPLLGLEELGFGLGGRSHRRRLEACFRLGRLSCRRRLTRLRLGCLDRGRRLSRLRLGGCDCGRRLSRFRLGCLDRGRRLSRLRLGGRSSRAALESAPARRLRLRAPPRWVGFGALGLARFALTLGSDSSKLGRLFRQSLEIGWSEHGRFESGATGKNGASGGVSSSAARKARSSAERTASVAAPGHSRRPHPAPPAILFAGFTSATRAGAGDTQRRCGARSARHKRRDSDRHRTPGAPAARRQRRATSEARRCPPHRARLPDWRAAQAI